MRGGDGARGCRGRRSSRHQDRGSWCGWFAAPGLEPTYSAREAAARLGRSYSWPDQRLRGDKFVLPDGTKVEPRRTAGGDRRFTLAMLEDIALSSFRHGWFRMDELKSTYRELLMAAYRDTGEAKIPG